MLAENDRSTLIADMEAKLRADPSIQALLPQEPPTGVTHQLEALFDDADAHLGIREAPEIKSVSDFIARQHELTLDAQDRLAHQLGIGRPRSNVSDLGQRTDLATGKILFDPLAPTCHDLDCDPDLYGKSPLEIVKMLERREAIERGEQDDDARLDVVRLMQRKIVIRGSHGGGRRRQKQGPRSHSSIDQAAIHSVAGSFGS